MAKVPLFKLLGIRARSPMMDYDDSGKKRSSSADKKAISIDISQVDVDKNTEFVTAVGSAF